jgi:hypothetical protein
LRAHQRGQNVGCLIDFHKRKSRKISRPGVMTHADLAVVVFHIDESVREAEAIARS